MMIPFDNEEYLMIGCFTLSLRSGMSSVECDYMIVRDFCKRYKLDTLAVFRVCKAMVGELNSKK